MATLSELDSLIGNPDLQSKLKGAVLVAAYVVQLEDSATVNHANRLLWARSALQNPGDAAKVMLNAVLAANNSATLSNITGATDAQINTAVQAAIDIVAGE